MKGRITTLILLILLTSCVSAIEIYSGESYEIDLEKSYEYYSIVGNSTPVNVSVTQNGNIVTIIPGKYSQSDSYEIIFFDSEKEVIYQSSGGGGGGTRKIYVDRNITKFVDKEIITEVPGDILETEKIVKRSPWWNIILILILIVIIIEMVFYIRSKSDNTSERRFEEDENE